MPFSQIWEGGNELSAPVLDEIRSVGLLSADERKARMHGRCAASQWFKLCGGGFRIRAAFANATGGAAIRVAIFPKRRSVRNWRLVRS